MNMISSFFLGVLVTAILGFAYVRNADSRCLARAETARADYRLKEQLRNGEIAVAQDIIVEDNISRQISRTAKFNFILKRLQSVTHEGCIYPDALKEALVEAENIN